MLTRYLLKFTQLRVKDILFPIYYNKYGSSNDKYREISHVYQRYTENWLAGTDSQIDDHYPAIFKLMIDNYRSYPESIKAIFEEVYRIEKNLAPTSSEKRGNWEALFSHANNLPNNIETNPNEIQKISKWISGLYRYYRYTYDVNNEGKNICCCTLHIYPIKDGEKFPTYEIYYAPARPVYEGQLFSSRGVVVISANQGYFIGSEMDLGNLAIFSFQRLRTAYKAMTGLVVRRHSEGNLFSAKFHAVKTDHNSWEELKGWIGNKNEDDIEEFDTIRKFIMFNISQYVENSDSGSVEGECTYNI